MKLFHDDFKSSREKKKNVKVENRRRFVVFYRRKLCRLREDSIYYFTIFVVCLVKKIFRRLFRQKNLIDLKFYF